MHPALADIRVRRIVTLTAGIAILLLAALTAWAAGRFSDDDGNIHEGNIEAVAAEGITRGCNPPENTLYCPTDPVTRGQMAAFLRRAFNLPESVQDWFIDDDASIFEGDINALAEAGITRGCNPPRNNQFCPDGFVTRGQMAAFLRRAFNLSPSSSDLFVDDDGSVFEADINSIAQEGITRGCNPPVNNRYCPDDLVLRDQMASFLARALGLTPITPPDPCADFPASAIFVSTSGSDGNDGTCDSPVRTIQRGIDIAPVGGLVVVDSGIYHEVIEIPKSLTVEGLGSGLTVIDGAVGGDQDPAVRVRLGVTVEISGFTVRNGPAGGIESAAMLTVEDMEITGNGGDSFCKAGGIANLTSGTFVGQDLEVLGNRCRLIAGAAGGIWNGGSLEIRNSLIRGNSSEFSGGGLVNEGLATIFGTTVSFNEARFNGGAGVTNWGELNISNSVVSDNAVTEESGGGFLNGGQATLDNVSLVRNESGLNGGGLATTDNSSSVLLRNVLVANNDSGVNADYSSQEHGGGISHGGGTLTIESSAVVNNAANAPSYPPFGAAVGAGIYAAATTSMVNVTISGNSTEMPGGGLYIEDGFDPAVVTATNLTITDNAALEGGGLYVQSGSIDLTNSLLAASVSGLNCVVDEFGSGELSSQGHNLDDDDSCGLDSAGDLVNMDPQLGALTDNGGFTPTHALLSGSPAIDAGDDIAAPAVDQRGIARPQGAASDIGAYEAVP